MQLSEWLESNNLVELDETHCATRVDLVAKVQGLLKAENYVKQLPESLRTDKVYGVLLASCVHINNVKKAEELFDNMKDSEFPLTSYACNQMLCLYKKTERSKIAEILQLMEERDIIPSAFTYNILIDVKGQENKIDEMEDLLEKLEAQGLKPTSQIQKSIAQYYVNAGMLDKAEAVLKEIEGDGLEKNRWACRLLIPIYASLGRAEEVERIWKTCESDPYVEDCLAAIEAWGKLKEIEKAEAAFNKLLKKVKNPSSKLYAALLNIYARNKMLDKGKELVNRMASSGCKMGPLALDALVSLYLGAGEVEKADSILEKAIQKRIGKPMFNTYMAVMGKYADRGDVHNTEKTFHMMRVGGYAPRIRQYQCLLKAYITAKKPAYGFRDRMKADNVVPSRMLSYQLADMNIFDKSPVCDLLV